MTNIAPTFTLRTPALVMIGRDILWKEEDGSICTPTLKEARSWAKKSPPIVCHLPTIMRGLEPLSQPAHRIKPLPSRDILELFAFARPAQDVLPTIPALTQLLTLPPPQTPQDHLFSLMEIAQVLLGELATQKDDETIQSLAHKMANAQWSWGADVLKSIDNQSSDINGLEVWNYLDEWDEVMPQNTNIDHIVRPDDAENRLKQLTGRKAEYRQEQITYTRDISRVFNPRVVEGMPQIALIEAGTGVGKTLGYIAPASLWAEQTGGTVWISTFTKNLQQQIDREFHSLYPDTATHSQKVVVRKGRENYLCLLNFDNFIKRTALDNTLLIKASLLARWARYTRDGDLGGNDLPGWLMSYITSHHEIVLTDRHGECIYSSCPYYRKCFIERVIRRTRQASFVIANHALVIAHAVSNTQSVHTPTRYIFDEGHHIFNAADNAFKISLCGSEGREMRRWILGSEKKQRSLAQGIANRMEYLLNGHMHTIELIHKIQKSALCLPDEGWLTRITEQHPRGYVEAFLAQVCIMVRARVQNADSPFDLEIKADNPTDQVKQEAMHTHGALGKLAASMTELHQVLIDRLDTEAQTLESTLRRRLEGTAQTLTRRIETLRQWQIMLQSCTQDTNSLDNKIGWFSINRINGRDIDTTFNSHFVDPTEPFCRTVLNYAHGVAITSATLRDCNESDTSWESAEHRTGAQYLPEPAFRSMINSPFDFSRQTKVFIIQDVPRDNVKLVSAAFRELFMASKGGALGLFTAISRLQQIYAQISEPLENAGYTLYAQHVDEIDNSSLVDMFRENISSCLFGTDAMRDGVDVPGSSLRLVVFERVPWPRRSVLHTARRQKMGANAYDDMLIRLKLKQAFGRLIRTNNDYGVFVILDNRTPNRLLNIFPEATSIQRVGLTEALKDIQTFFDEQSAPLLQKY